jgi:photosystem II stability/assembly factor-like uncharacterized protein
LTSSRNCILVSAFVLSLAPVSPARAADPRPTPKPLPESLSDQLDGMKFRCIGPYRGGRVTAVTGVRAQPLTFYMGATGGGVWKTNDGGGMWEPVSDKDFKTGSVGALAVAPSDPNVVYVGMGEAPIRGNVTHGDGVYKSMDAGKTWQNVGLAATSQISAIRVHPKNADLVYVAAQGKVWASNGDRGVYRSEDGGKTWKKVLYVDEKTGAADLSMDPSNPRVLYAAFWQVFRRPWTMESGGEGGGIWKTTDGGDTWKKLAGGLPEGLAGKIGVAVSPARPERIFALVEAEKGGLYRSDDGGEKWTRINKDHKLIQRAWYYMGIFADPKSPDVVYVANVQFHRSADGGKSFQRVRTPHGDNHDLWIDPDDPNRMIEGNDGGATITVNGGKTWSTLMNQPTAQIYRVSTDDRFPYWVYGAQQDNTDVAIPSAAPGRGIDRTDWYPAGGGESGWVAPDPKNPDIIYGGGYGGDITRHDRRTQQSQEIIAWAQAIDGQATKDLKYRFNWNAPILLSRWDGTVLYHAAQVLLRSRDAGHSWEEISPDLTRNDKSKQGVSGGPLTKEVTGVETYDTIFYVAESRLEKGVIWAGSDDGLVHVTRDDGKTWKNVTPAGLPEWIQINALETSPRDKATAYVAATMYKWDDLRPYMYKTTDYGATWTKIVNGLPANAFTRVVREDPGRKGLLYCGTEAGLFVSFDDGASWQAFQRNLPPVPITDLAVKNGDLVVATQGRSFWILDDLSPLHQWGGRQAFEEFDLFRPRAAYRTNVAAELDDAPPRPVGKNPPAGGVVNYWMKEAPREGERLTLEILEGDKVIRTFTDEKKDPDAEGEKDDESSEKPLEPKAGLNRFVWDLKLMNPKIVAKKETFGDFEPEGPAVPPGLYTVRVKLGPAPEKPGEKASGKAAEKPRVGGWRTLEASEKIEVKADPRLTASEADLNDQYRLLRTVRDDVEETHDLIRKVRDVRAQVKDVSGRAEKIGKGTGLKEKAKTLTERLTALEEKLINPKIESDQDSLNFKPQLDHALAMVAAVAGSADTKPTAATLVRYKELRTELDGREKEFQALVEDELLAFNTAVREAQVPPVAVVPKAK